ncbi:hypothetical protein PAECIP111893_02086 [Paenibacillus plantiphilus]|uniref:Uncharacterized protein n=1 Tax=Paenibacillus plantiphilus TaxID=2905650 RepID=A0ABN8GEJ2_9BACL|nr:hypothetical protein [Paenibacillus plantiphilus]CAH1203837.1 hypothetical protein PAECIP111893_02086 [Paenibacillus plantiphilus]
MNQTEKVKFDTAVNNAVHRYMREKKSTCMYPGCEMEAINSHSISEMSSLETLNEQGEDRNLLAPKSRMAYPNKSMLIEDCGIPHASTFKGFCKLHDEMFARLDQSGIKSEKDLFRQVFRSLSYHVFREKVIDVIRPKFMEKIEKEKLEDEKLHGEWDSQIAKLIDFGCSNAAEQINKRIEILDKQRLEVKRFLDIMVDTHYTYPLTDFTGPEIPVYVVYKRLGFQVPVAVNGKISFTFGDGFSHYVILICMPAENTTDFIIITDKEFHAKETEYLAAIVNDDVYILNLIERFMVMTDEWWIKPSIYNNLSEERKRILIEDLYCYGEGLDILGSYDMSIFDELRLQLIDELPDHRRLYELQKIYELPKRAELEERKKKIQHKFNQPLFSFEIIG